MPSITQAVSVQGCPAAPIAEMTYHTTATLVFSSVATAAATTATVAGVFAKMDPESATLVAQSCLGYVGEGIGRGTAKYFSENPEHVAKISTAILSTPEAVSLAKTVGVAGAEHIPAVAKSSVVSTVTSLKDSVKSAFGCVIS